MRRSRFIWVLAVLGTVGGCKKADETVVAPAPPPAAVVEDAATSATHRALAAVLEPALSAYNAGDQKALFADFATTATPPANDRIFNELYEGYYKTEFGRIVTLRPYPAETLPDADYGMLVYLAQCEWVPLAKVSANFIRENGLPKIMQLRIERVEAAAK